jgi:uncharacterized protein (DUF58 family)
MIDPHFFSALDAMAVQLKRHALGKYQGEQKTVYAGDGLTFKDFAPYTLGDDFRRIDWRIYARTKELFVKRFEEDRNLTIHILLDASGSMAYGGKQSKFSRAATLALGVAYIAQKQHEHVEFSLFSHYINPLKYQNQNISVQAMTKQINDIRAHGTTDFNKIMEGYKERVRSKSLIFIFSDFLYPVESLARLLALYQRSNLYLVQVLHKDEVDLPFHGEARFIDPEYNKKTIKTYVSHRMKSIYNDALNEHIKAIQDACKGHKARFLQVDTRETSVDNFIRLWQTIS